MSYHKVNTYPVSTIDKVAVDKYRVNSAIFKYIIILGKR